MNRPRILFTSAFIPYRKLPIIEDNIDFFYYKNTLFQKIFHLKQVLSHHPLHLIAQNQPCPAVVIENPTWNQFTKEITDGDYDVVAITFTVPLTEKILKMVRLIKRKNQKIEIILGGYGTAIFDQSFGLEKEIKKYVDRICFGEGISFFRSYLNERWGINVANQPLKQDLVETKNYLFETKFKLFGSTPFVKSVGCRNGCVFCSTSAYFNMKKITLFEYEDLYEIISKRLIKDKKSAGITIYDEDFLENGELNKFAELMKDNEKIHKKPVFLSVFTTLKSLNNYRVEQLLKAGIITVFVGIESCYDDIIEQERLRKRKIENLMNKIEELHHAGINTYGSMIIGWDGHNDENIRRDLKMFIELHPTLYQVVALHPEPGTELWRKILQEDRLPKDYRYADNGSVYNFRYKNFTPEQIKEYSLQTLKNLVLEDGPWPFRFFRNIYSGYNYLENTKDLVLKWRREGYFKLLKKFLPLVFISYFLFFGVNFRKKINATLNQFRKQFPIRFCIGFFQACVLILPLHVIYLYGLLKYKLNRYPDQPDFSKRRYNP